MGKKCCIASWTAAVIAAGIIAVLVAAYGVLRHVDIAVEEASLTRFALAETTTTSSPAAAAAAVLAYNLSLTLAVRNPNWAITVKNRKKLEAACTFDGQPFDRVLLAGKGDKQGPRKTRVYHLAVSSNGAAVPALGNAGAAEFRKQNATGFFEVEVKVTGKFSYTGRLTKCDLDATCPLKLQLAPPGTKAVVFQKVKCKLAKPKKYC
ncbi:hypothetical protein SEVIR_2G101000v4 [Setaria viridis]|uniref:Uncharacterized protein n=1 Tax=Setaria viridis TaxID=4556 RepID=A0A4U6VU00_SETVI|nr:NDR1/HIN1-like protein 10 [Setaria viridis]TKW31369.1 hypothetical protein SEVIR_2G101000v2 [Setaria viridis]